MNHGGNQAALGVEVLGVTTVVPVRRNRRNVPTFLRVVTRARSWLDGRHEARANARAAHDEHVEAHWHKMSADHDESWRWRANGF